MIFHIWVLFKVIFYFPNRTSTMTGESMKWRFFIFWKPLRKLYTQVLFQDEPTCTLSNPRKLSDFALDVFYSSKNCIWFAWRISILLCMKLEFGIKWLMSTEMSLNWWVLHAKRDLSFAICQDWDFKRKGNLNSRLSGTIVVPWIFLITASCLKKLEFV